MTRRPPRIDRLALCGGAWAVVLAGLALYAMSLLARDQPGRIPALDGWYWAGLTLAAVGLVAHRAWRVAGERWEWLLIGAGVACVAIANLVYTVWLPDAPFPSVVDLLWDAFYPFVFAGLLLLLRQRLRKLSAALRLDALGAGLAVTAVAAALVPNRINDSSNDSLPVMLAGLVCPVGDTLLLALMVGALAMMGWRVERQSSLGAPPNCTAARSGNGVDPRCARQTFYTSVTCVPHATMRPSPLTYVTDVLSCGDSCRDPTFLQKRRARAQPGVFDQGARNVVARQVPGPGQDRRDAHRRYPRMLWMCPVSASSSRTSTISASTCASWF